MHNSYSCVIALCWCGFGVYNLLFFRLDLFYFEDFGPVKTRPVLELR